MALTKERKQELVKTHRRSAADTASSEVQIALFTERINYLTQHFETHKKDHHSRQGLMRLINKRRKLLDYLNASDPARYKQVIKNLKIRK